MECESGLGGILKQSSVVALFSVFSLVLALFGGSICILY
jgi:hypothetical protein